MSCVAEVVKLNNNQKMLKNKSDDGKQKESPIVPIGQFIENSRFVVTDKKISEGSFSLVYLGKHAETGLKAAIKLEPKNSDKPQLFLEFGFYHTLGQRRGIPHIYHLGPVGLYNALVIELLGPSLQKMLKLCNNFSMRTLVQVTIQMINLFEYIHSRGLIYRDIKPENFVLGAANTENWWVVYIIDLGFCKQYLDKEGKHIEYQEGKYMTGTLRYMSINNNLGRENSRRDDLEALGYVFVYLYKGTLPWMGVKGTSVDDKYMTTAKIKIETTPEKLCENMPLEYTDYLTKVQSYQFEEEPDYKKLNLMFVSLLAALYGLEVNDKVYDWDRAHIVKSRIYRRF